MSGKFGLLRLCFHKMMSTFRFGKATASIYALNRLNAFRIRRALPAVIAVTLMYSIGACADGNTLQIAVIGPLSGKDSAGGQAMLDGVNLCVAEINERGGISGRKLEVLVYDDQNSKEIARKKAIEIVRDINALAVIGHYYSSTSVEGGKIYKQYGIPAVTPSATAS